MSSVIGKHDGTGGEVSVGTVTSQLLYEIGSPAYLGPDVTARFDTIALEAVGRDRVRISGARGEAPPATLKVVTNELGGYRQSLTVAITGLDVEAKARLVEAAFWRACPLAPAAFDSVTVRLDRTDKPDPPTNPEAVALWRITLKDRDERKVGRAVADAAVELALSTIPGFFMLGGAPGPAAPYGVYHPSAVPADLVPQCVTVLGEATTVVDSVAPRRATTVEPAPGPAAGAPGGETRRAPLGRVVGRALGRQGRRRQPRRLRALRRGLGLARRLPERGRAAPPPARDRRPRRRAPPAGQPARPQLRGARALGGGRRGVDAPGRPGQGPRRVAARPGGRRAGRAAGVAVSAADAVRADLAASTRPSTRSSPDWTPTPGRGPRPRPAGASPTRSATSRTSTAPRRSRSPTPTAFAASASDLVAGVIAGGLDEVTLGPARAMAPGELLAQWRDARAGLLAAAAAHDPASRVPWYGPDMSLASFLGARVMETWAHGTDVADALGVEVPATDRLSHVARLGVATRAWSYVVRGDAVPEGRVRVSLTAPSGATWEYGDADADDAVTGPALDFCLVVTQRRHLDDTALACGELGRDWLVRAQCFAGGPTLGPTPRGSRAGG